MVIHNSTGVKAATKAGFKRIILARELSIKEIEEIQKSAPTTELELFVHGAICYSISGLCLASSYLGGQSGNRGRCTQVCRRYYSTGQSAGFYFSPKDFCAIDFVEDYKRIGISSLKIEGRMKSAQYVHTVVSAYRKAIDNTAPIDSIKEDLLLDLGREKTPFFLNNINQKNIINASSPPGTGYLIGNVQGISNTGFKINSDKKLSAGDKIRFHSTGGIEGKSMKINKLSCKNGMYTILSEKTPNIKNGDYVYLISRSSSGLKKREKQSNVKPISFKRECPFSKKILNKYTHSKKETKTRTALYLRINRIDWLFLMKPDLCDGIIFQCELKDLHKIKKDSALLGKWSKNLIVSLPPFLSENDLPFWEKAINECNKIGINKWMCSQFGQKELIPKNCVVYSDTSIWCTNRATQQFLKQERFNNFSYSFEDDILNLKATGNSRGFITLFSLVPLFISRIKPPLSNIDFLVDKKDYGFFIKNFNGLYYLLGEKPLCLTHRRDKLNAAGINNFILDFSFYPPKKKFLKTILDHYRSKTKIPGTALFNHKDGFK